MSKEYGFGRSLTARGSLRPGLMTHENYVFMIGFPSLTINEMWLNAARFRTDPNDALDIPSLPRCSTSQGK